MSIKDGKDYIYLIWKQPVTRKQYVVGQLSKNGQYEFCYGFEVEKAIEEGFELLISFDDIKKTYTSDVLFPVFSSRLPDKKRNGIEKILSKYDLEEYDAYKLLKRSGAKLPIDNLEFIDPILNLDGLPVKRYFYLAGPRHYINCDGTDCEKAILLSVDESLCLKQEPSNHFDKNAIMILNDAGYHIGYVPRYYSESVSELLKIGHNYKCKIVEIEKNLNCNECIKVEIEIL